MLEGRSIAAQMTAGLRRRLKRTFGLASVQDLHRVAEGASAQSAIINHGLVELASRVTSIEDFIGGGVVQGRVGELEGRLQDVSGRIDAEHGRLEALGEDMLNRTDGLIAQHAESREWLTGLDVRVGDLSRRVAGADLLRDSSDAIERFLDPDFGAVEGFRRPPGEDVTQADIYLGFESWFRGTEQTIGERQQVYVTALSHHAPVLDIGCGRGELLELLAARGVDAKGVDTDAAMVARCREKGLDVAETDAVTALAGVTEGSLGAVFAAQVIEHLPYTQLIGFLVAAKRAIRDGGLLIVETVNPHSPQGLKHFWVDPTHQHPLFAETMLSLCHFSGYREGFCWYPQGTGDPDADRLTQLDYAIVARPG